MKHAFASCSSTAKKKQQPCDVVVFPVLFVSTCWVTYYVPRVLVFVPFTSRRRTAHSQYNLYRLRAATNDTVCTSTLNEYVRLVFSVHIQTPTDISLPWRVGQKKIPCDSSRGGNLKSETIFFDFCGNKLTLERLTTENSLFLRWERHAKLYSVVDVKKTFSIGGRATKGEPSQGRYQGIRASVWTSQ